MDNAEADAEAASGDFPLDEFETLAEKADLHIQVSAVGVPNSVHCPCSGWSYKRSIKCTG